MSGLGAKCPLCNHENPRSLGRYFKGVDDIEEIEETYVCDGCQIIFKRTGLITWGNSYISQSSKPKVKK